LGGPGLMGAATQSGGDRVVARASDPDLTAAPAGWAPLAKGVVHLTRLLIGPAPPLRVGLGQGTSTQNGILS
jgi:hypothetical protein